MDIKLKFVNIKKCESIAYNTLEIKYDIANLYKLKWISVC